MKKLFLLSLAILPLYAGASCQDSIVSDKYILFVDTNDSALEIETAEKAACARGEKMMIVPKDYKEYHAVIGKVEAAKNAVKKCGAKHKDKAYEKCTEVRDDFDTVHRELYKFKIGKREIKNATEDALKEIKKLNGKMSSIIISGHDGGGSFGGHKGRFTKEELGEMIGKYKDINEVKSLMLLGCYTGVQKEIIDWKKLFPDVKMIAGYDDSAPLSDKPFGHQYITELLTKEKDLIANADQEKLKKFVGANIKSLGQLHSAVYVNCEESGGQELYYSSKKRDKGFSEYGAKECMSKGPEFEAIATSIAAYASGEKEPPQDTARGEIRQLYIQARNLEHCEVFLGKQLNVNAIFNLLFYEGIKSSFVAYYQDDLAKADKAVQEMLAKYPNLIKDIWAPTAENLKKFSRKDMLLNIHNIHGLLAQKEVPNEEKRILSWIASASTNHLQHFQNPFSWHEYESGIPEKPTIAIPLATYRSTGMTSYGGGGMVAGSMGGGMTYPAPSDANQAQDAGILNWLFGR